MIKNHPCTNESINHEKASIIKTATFIYMHNVNGKKSATNRGKFSLMEMTQSSIGNKYTSNEISTSLGLNSYYTHKYKVKYTLTSSLVTIYTLVDEYF